MKDLRIKKWPNHGNSGRALITPPFYRVSKKMFIGDSDSGKSIIADLLQLIFVGSSVFRSATIPVKDRREPDGLVLRSPGKSLDYGYCISAHKSQSSSYLAVLVDMENILQCTDPEELRQLQYVALSRTTNDIYLYQR